MSPLWGLPGLLLVLDRGFAPTAIQYHPFGVFPVFLLQLAVGLHQRLWNVTPLRFGSRFFLRLAVGLHSRLPSVTPSGFAGKATSGPV